MSDYMKGARDALHWVARYSSKQCDVLSKKAEVSAENNQYADALRRDAKASAYAYLVGRLNTMRSYTDQALENQIHNPPTPHAEDED